MATPRVGMRNTAELRGGSFEGCGSSHSNARPGRVTEEFQTMDGAEVMGSRGDGAKKGNCEPQSWQTFQRTAKPQNFTHLDQEL